ncbi:MAG: alanine--tRNA ligase [Deltaproteobacteria bacterium]|nr:alanine--tRNA ligase [Deltaproteobacteria bacterium]
MSATSREIRQTFLEYFRTQGHEVVPSAPLVPRNDPTLMFTVAGMVPFKDLFLGREKRSYTRAASSQCCIRISGKHNDLENVGVTARHHTFFEMLGNFSFGDYFKADAIRFAWELLTERLAIPRDRLVVTVFGGEQGIAADEEAVRLWKDATGFGDDRILRLGLADNFWAAGDTGPCGPCSEIHFFTGPSPDLSLFGREPDETGRGWLEIWNLVFMQFERDASGTLTPLPRPSIDTGAGLERVTSAIQGVSSNYDTDLLRPLCDLAAEIAKKRYGGTLSPDDVSMRVLADHARMTAFLVAEGVFPDKDGREYVLRRVMRRAVRHAHRLGIAEPFFDRVALRVVDLMGDVYPQLRERRTLIESVSRQEEERFRATLDRGLRMIADFDRWRTKDGGRRELPGDAAFKLYDTFGFPLDLQDVIGAEEGFDVDRAGFDRAMAEAQERSSKSKLGGEATDVIHRAIREELGPVVFTGYEHETDDADVMALVANGARVETVAAGTAAEVVTRRTPFYGEAGGQVGDVGVITTASGTRFVVETTQKPLDDLIVMQGRLESGSLRVGETVHLEVDHEKRAATRRNHSATHLLHLALRSVLGEHVVQKGSLVGPDVLRFDFSHGGAMSDDEIRRVEDIVNDRVLRNVAVETKVLAQDAAKAEGAIGIFEEKYGDVVRMLRIADSLELCGGTHASRTGDIGLFKIVSESGIAAGVRRIFAATGHHVIDELRARDEVLAQAAQSLKGSSAEVAKRVEKLVAHERELLREIDQLKRKLASGAREDLMSSVVEVGGVRVLAARTDIGDVDAMRTMADGLRDKLGSGIVALGTIVGGDKVALVATVTKDLTAKHHAGKLIGEIAKVVGGRGGGRPDFAQAGGPDVTKLDDAISRVRSLIGD